MTFQEPISTKFVSISKIPGVHMAR